MDEYLIELPNDMEIEAMTDGESIDTKFGSYSFKIEKLENNTIKYSRRYKVFKGDYEKSDYDAFRDFRKQVLKHDKTKIVLVKNKLILNLKMKKLLSLWALTLITTFIQAQDYKFGEVSIDELNENVHPQDPDTNAAILYKNEDISFYFSQSDGFMQERVVHQRIKIYNKEGYDWATKRVYLYNGGGNKTEKLRNVKGYTFNKINGEIEKDKLKKDGVFEEEFNEYTKINTITMPNVQDGSVVEFTYKIVSVFGD
ncbi:DUF3857 domain-containing protein [Winogradskyella maritima]|nr:DUF3857 domain-containing protein [Winogradskyella maritima]